MANQTNPMPIFASILVQRSNRKSLIIPEEWSKYRGKDINWQQEQLLIKVVKIIANWIGQITRSAVVFASILAAAAK